MKEKKRRLAVLLFVAILSIVLGIRSTTDHQAQVQPDPTTLAQPPAGSAIALSALETIEVKGRAPKTDYKRTQFLSDWAEVGGCDMRNLILRRDLTNVFIDPIDNCKILSGRLDDPYTAKIIQFERGEQSSQAVQIDHVVALSDAWQKGAQQLTQEDRNEFANDPLNLLAVDGPANQNKSDGDAATWLPSNKAYRCRYVARQIAVKTKFHLWITLAEKDAIKRQLQTCPGQVLPVESSSE